MKTILYATDCSDRSVSALRIAHQLAKKLSAEWIALHVFDVPVGLASPGSISYLKKEKELFKEHRIKLEEFCVKHLESGSETLKPKFVVEENASIVSGIQECARQVDADVVVVGTKGAGGVQGFFLGSTTRSLIKNAIPILAVPETSTVVEFKNMAYATDFEQADFFAIQKLVHIAQVFKASIRIIHVTTKKEYGGDQQMEWFREMLLQKVDYELDFMLVFSDSIFEELQQLIEKYNIDILAMLARKNSSFLERIFETDLVGKMVKDIRIPLLSFRDLK